jgi:hypothetical protein
VQSLATNRENLLQVAAVTLETLQSQSFQQALDEGTPESAGTDTGERDAVADAIVAALDWARLEKDAKPEAVLESTEAGGNVPYVPSNQVLSLIQSAYDEYLEAQEEGVEAPFDTTDVRWASVVLEKIKAWLKGKHRFVAHKSTSDFRYDLPPNAVVALFSDWGTGEETAKRVLRQIKAAAPTHAIHLGDVYYAGTPKEVQDRFLKVIDQAGPSRASCRYYSLNANHDMYSGGYGYFDSILPSFGQEASYFNLRNQDWQLIGLDSGYEDHGLQDPQKDWVAAQLANRGTAKSVLLSHHQLFSPYESRAYDRALHKKIGPMLSQVYAWFWGHEHRCLIFEDRQGIKARCIGHGAIPESVPFGDPQFPDVKVRAVDQRGTPEDPGVGIHGFALLKFNGPNLEVTYIDEFGGVFFKEQL